MAKTKQETRTSMFTSLAPDADLERALEVRRRESDSLKRKGTKRWWKNSMVLVPSGIVTAVLAASGIVNMLIPAEEPVGNASPTVEVADKSEGSPSGKGEPSMLTGLDALFADSATSTVMEELLHAQSLYSDKNGTSGSPDFGTVEELMAAGTLTSTFNDGDQPVAIQLQVYDRSDGKGEGFYARGIAPDGSIYVVDDAGAGVIHVSNISHDYGKAIDRFGDSR